MRKSCVIVALLGLAASIWAESEPNAFDPVLDMTKADGDIAESYGGFIVTDELSVSLVPALKSTDKDEIGGARFICGYRLYNDNDFDIPFRAEVTNHLNGAAKLIVKDGTDLKQLKRRKFKFELAAFDCGSPTRHSERKSVLIHVLSQPEENIVTPPLPDNVDEIMSKKFASPPLPPVIPDSTTNFPKLKIVDNGNEDFFERNAYLVTMREGTLYDSILRLRPAEGKSTEDICGYEMTTTDVPFTVDSTGNVYNTAALDFNHQKSYILTVVAKHCNGRVSNPTSVNVQISQMCTSGWKDLPVELEYRAGTKAVHPFEKTWFDTCSTQCRENENLDVTVSLDSKGKLFSCDHDTYSIQSQREVCGASKSAIELLPKGETWTTSLNSVEGHDSAYKFDGKTAVNVPSETSNHTLADLFTISMWMNHGEEKKDGHKEHVVCNSDGDGMNRHHYALFVHNCRLVFLLRRESAQVTDMNAFTPAEWRYSIPHVCDGKWHHYALSVQYPQVKLYVDGQVIQNDKGIVEVVDDWALHSSKKVHFQQLTVGACWQGGSKTFGQYFDGQLAGITLTKDTTETERVIKCLNSCGEKLSFHAMDLLEVGMSVAFNTELSEITIRGAQRNDVKMLLQKVGYSNTNTKPKTGYRSIHVSTNLTCDGRPIEVTAQNIPLMVSPVSDPEITISGLDKKLRSASEFRMGVDLFTELMIVSAPNSHVTGDEENKINKLDIEDISLLQKDLKKHLLLDRCQVRTDQPLNSNTEKLELPTTLLVKYLLDTKEYNQGFDITGSEAFTHYEDVLRETYYYNNAVDSTFTPRKFTVTCFDMNGRFTSNEYTVEVGLLSSGKPAVELDGELLREPAIERAVKLDDKSAKNYANMKEGTLNLESKSAGFSKASAGSGSNAVMIVVVCVCAMLLVGIIGFAVAKIKRSQSKRSLSHQVQVEEGPEMEWDNSTLNITVNPLEQDTLLRPLKDQEVVSESEEELMSSDDEAESQRAGLEWDNSTY